MEDNGYKYIHKLTHFVTSLISQRNCSIDLIPKIVRNSNFLSFLYSKPLRESRKPKFKIGGRVHSSKYDLPFRKGYKPQFTKDVFKIVAISSRKPPTYTIKDEQEEIIRGKFYQKELIKVINKAIVSNRVGFKLICATIARQYTELCYKLFSRAAETGKTMGGCNFRNILHIIEPKCYGPIIYVFWQETFKFVRILLSGNLVFTLPLRLFMKPWTLSFKKDTITAKVVSQLQCIDERKQLRFILKNEGCGLAFFSMDGEHKFGSNVANEFGVMLRGKGPLKPKIDRKLYAYALSW